MNNNNFINLYWVCPNCSEDNALIDRTCRFCKTPAKIILPTFKTEEEEITADLMWDEWYDTKEDREGGETI